MASHVYVIDSSFKRTQIKVTPGKSLREVLEEACKSRRLDPEEYTLKTQANKTLDLSQPFRLSGLSGGAKLQLTQASKTPGVVSVALQLPESEGSIRLNDKFPSTTTLWLILRKYEDLVAGSGPTKLNLTQRGAPSSETGAGRLLYEQPCLHVVGRNLETFADLQKTLGQLGLNGGSALIRLTFKRSDQPLEVAMLGISDYFGSRETQAASADGATARSADGAHSKASGTESSIPETEQMVDVPVAGETPGNEPNEDVDTQPGPTAHAIENDVIASSSIGSQPTGGPPSSTTTGISVYRPPSSDTPAAALQPDDPAVFEPSIDHAKAHQAALNRASKPQRLLSDKELAEQESQRQEVLATVRNVVVRVRYPDQSQIETTILPSESAADMYARVEATLAAGPAEPFELRYTATVNGKTSHQALSRSPSVRLVRDCGFRGKVMLTLVWGPSASAATREGPSLKEEYRRQATELKVQMATPHADDTKDAGPSHGKAGVNDSSKGPGGSGKKVDAEARMKRFLGLGKK